MQSITSVVIIIITTTTVMMMIIIFRKIHYVGHLRNFERFLVNIPQRLLSYGRMGVLHRARDDPSTPTVLSESMAR